MTNLAHRKVERVLNPRKENGMFEIRVRVKWSSQAAGFAAQKTGEVVAVVPPGHDPRMVAQESPGLATLPRRFDGGQRDHESYLVAVRTGKTDKALPALYWPRVKGLSLAEAVQG